MGCLGNKDRASKFFKFQFAAYKSFILSPTTHKYYCAWWAYHIP